MSTVAISFLAFLGLFLGVGILSVRRKKDTTADYLVASRNVNPWFVALSAVATNNSGFMFVGLIGTTFTEGISSMWIMIGWVFGDYLMWLWGIPRALRTHSEATDTVTIPSFLGHGLGKNRIVTIVAGLITLIFLGTYAAAQLTAGGKALLAAFGWEEVIGAAIGAAIVLIYCFSGGIRASIWTDVVQSIVMLLAMVGLCAVAVDHLGGFGSMWATLAEQDPQLIAINPASTQFGTVLFIAGWFVAGMGVVGQPHIMIRVMAITSPEDMDTARNVYFVWNLLFAAAAITVGLAARAALTDADFLAAFPDAIAADRELALPLLAGKLFPPVLVGMVLAGLFAATMSTADSQVLSCSAALTQDLFPQAGKRHIMVKLGTVFVCILVFSLTFAGQSVFQLVVLAWSALAAGLGPLLIVRALNRAVSARVAVWMMVTGIVTVLLWRYSWELSASLYDVMPGMAAGFVVYLVAGAWNAWEPASN
jgi:sodium/proline symporter